MDGFVHPESKERPPPPWTDADSQADVYTNKEE
jgi:hypothetical protein